MTKKLVSILIIVCLVMTSVFQVALAAKPSDYKELDDLQNIHKWKNIITDLKIDSSEYSLNIGERHHTIVYAYFKNKFKANVTSVSGYKSSNPKVASVDNSGVVKAVSAGTATITVSFYGKTASATVKVLPNLVGISLDSESYNLAMGEKRKIKVTARYSDNTTADITNRASYTSSNSAVASVDASGEVTAKGQGEAIITAAYSGFTATATIAVKSPEWILVWGDEFNDTVIDSTKWTFDLGNGGSNPGWGNNEKELYKSDLKNAKEEDGVLKINAIKDSDDAAYPYTSARVKTQGLFSKKYGKFEIRAKAPGGKGLWPAVWMLPKDNVYGTWAASGEVDIFEGWGSDTSKMCGTLHYGGLWPNNIFAGKTYYFPEGGTTEEFHTYTLEWEPGEMRWYVDGILYSTQNSWYSKGVNTAANYTYPAPFDQEFYLLMNLAVGGNFDGEPTEATQFPATMQVDYVRIYDLSAGYRDTPTKPDGSSAPLPEGYMVQENGNLIYANDYANGFIEETDSTKVPADTVVSKADGKWLFLHLQNSDTGSIGYGGNGTIATEAIDGKNYAKVNVTAAGTQTYSVQLIKTATLARGRTYKASFDAKASKNRRIVAKLSGDGDTGWASYSTNDPISLTTDIRNYEFIFTMEKDSDLKARFEFNLGADTGTIWIGNVRLEEIQLTPEDENLAKVPLTGGNHVYNGTFDQGDDPDKLRMKYWNFTTIDAAATASVKEALPRELVVDITNGGTSTDAVRLVQKGMSLIKGQSYEVTFKCRGAAERSIGVELLSKDGTVSYSGLQTINLSTNNEEMKFSFNMTADTDTEAQLMFKFGGANIDVYLDEVSMIRSSQLIDSSVVLFPVKNGEFDNQLASWNTYIIEGAAGTISNTADQAKAALTNVGNNPWSVMLTQENFKLSKDIEYLVEFDAKSTVSRNIEVVLENASYTRYLNQTVALTDQMKRYSFTFKMPLDDTGSLKFLMGKISGSEALGVHDIFIDNVVCEVKVAKQYVSLLKNGNFTDGTNDWTIGAYEGAVESHQVNDGALKISISDEGTVFWNVQVIQGNFTLENGKSYILTFDANSSIGRNIQPIIENSVNYTKYLQPVITVGSDKKTYGIKFTMEGVTDTAAHLVFALGRIDADITEVHDVYLSNISLIENPYGSAAPTQGHELLNGTFDADTGNWQVYAGDGSNAAASVEDGKLKVNFTNYDGWFQWSTQVFQDYLKLEANKTYTLSFDISSTQTKSILVDIEKAADFNIRYLPAQTVNLTTDTQTVSFDFTTGAQPEENAKLVFMLGSNNVPGESFTPHSIYIDNIRLVESTSVPQGKALSNGTFDSNMEGWQTYLGDGSDVVFTVEEGMLKAFFTNYDGWFTWSTQVYQSGLQLEGGKTYVLSFDASATEAKDILVSVEKTSDYNVKYLDTKIISLIPDTGTFTYQFTVSATEQNAKLLFQLGSNNATGPHYAGQSVFLDNITLMEKVEIPAEDELPDIWYLYNSPVTGVTPAGENLQVDKGSTNGWTTIKTFTDSTPSYWYSPVVSGTYSAGDWSFVLWTDLPTASATIEVSLYVVNSDGSEAAQIGNPQQLDVVTTGGGNHPSTFSFNGVGETKLENQRLMVKITKIGGANCTMAYNSDFVTRLITP